MPYKVKTLCDTKEKKNRAITTEKKLRKRRKEKKRNTNTSHILSHGPAN
jgi:hypothetical protein